MSSEAAEKLQELLAERDTLQARLNRMLRDERCVSYGALVLAGAAAAFVIWSTTTGDIPREHAGVILVIIGAIGALAYWLIRSYGLETMLNWASPLQHPMDDPLHELRDKLAACEQRIAALRAANPELGS